MIPKILHIIWVGDESKRPDNCIETWVKHNPGWQVQLWGNDDLVSTEWINAKHMREMSKRELNGVADLMRWEILYHQGGFVVDADSICQRPLEDWLLEGEAFACWENEIDRPKLIAAGYVASVPENPFFGQIIQDINAEESVVGDMAWKTVGPLRLTKAFYQYKYSNLTIWPSHFFIPQHFAGQSYEGGGRVFATQEWASTRRTYDTLHQRRIV
jgi:mannosyltransferase OCH1-like enzyme